MIDISAKNISNHSIATQRDDTWGLWVAGTGMRIAPARVPYQVHEADSPIQWGQTEEGRVIQHFGIVYVTEGRGTLDTRYVKARTVEAGHTVLLFPDQWHNYRPLISTGWIEYWVLFDGELARRWYRNGFVEQKRNLLYPGVDEKLLGLFEQLLALAEGHPPYFNQIQAGIMMQILATIHSRVQHVRDGGSQENTSCIEKAKCHLHDHWSRAVDMNELAASLHFSPRHFRRLFKESTGLSPNQYLMSLKINRAKLLLEQALTVKEVAYRVGFADPYHFSRLFKDKTGVSPSAWVSA